MWIVRSCTCCRKAALPNSLVCATALTSSAEDVERNRLCYEDGMSCHVHGHSRKRGSGTILENDSLDLLGEYMGKGAQIADLTNQAMDGSMNLEQVRATGRMYTFLCWCFILIVNV